MYTSYVGKKFLRLYNQKENKNFSAKEFFEEVFFEIFFNDEKHLMHVGNSPFFQKTTEQDIKKFGSKSLAQLNKLKESIANNRPNMSIFVGFATDDVKGTTSGQLTNIDFKIDEQEIYASWIGQALSVGVSGGYGMLIDKDEVLWSLYNGWRFYRKYLQQTPNVKDKQIETWNGHWLCHSFDKKYNHQNPEEGFTLKTTDIQGNIAIPTQEWARVVFALSKKYSKEVITAYCYNLSQTNTTLGFINIYLPEVRRLYELRDKLFINKTDTILSDKEIEELETFYRFHGACKLGTIGLKSLEPADLRNYMPKGSIDYSKGKEYKFSDEKSYLDYQLYKIWIIAMLNKTELLELAAKIAKNLLDYERPKDSNRGKTTSGRLVEEVINSSNVRTFIERLTDLLKESPEYADTFKNVVEYSLKMPSDNFPLFITLIRFEYQYQKSKN